MYENPGVGGERPLPAPDADAHGGNYMIIWWYKHQNSIIQLQLYSLIHQKFLMDK